MFDWATFLAVIGGMALAGAFAFMTAGVLREYECRNGCRLLRLFDWCCRIDYCYWCFQWLINIC